MSPRRAVVLAALASAGAATGIPAAIALAQPGSPAGCPPPGAHVIAGSGLARLFQASGDGGRLRTFVCLAGRSGRMIVSDPSPGVPSLAASSGPLVALLVTSFGVDSGSTVLRVCDVAARRVLRELNVGNYIDGGILEREAPTRVVMGPEGAVAWIASSYGPDRRVTYTVRSAATIGPIETLDEGPHIDPARLTLSGRQLGWRDGSRERHSPMA